MITARDVMLTEFASVVPEASLETAVDIMLAEHVSGLPVVEAGTSRLLGVITEFSLVDVVYKPELLTEPVSEHMTSGAVTVCENEPVGRLANLFQLHRVRFVPVERDGLCVGVISRRDLIQFARQHRCTVAEKTPADRLLAAGD